MTKANNERIFCDNCGESEDDGADFKAFTRLPYDVASAGEGESGVVCHPCDTQLSKGEA